MLSQDPTKGLGRAWAFRCRVLGGSNLDGRGLVCMGLPNTASLLPSAFAPALPPHAGTADQPTTSDLACAVATPVLLTTGPSHCFLVIFPLPNFWVPCAVLGHLNNAAAVLQASPEETARQGPRQLSVAEQQNFLPLYTSHSFCIACNPTFSCCLKNWGIVSVGLVVFH